MRRWFARLFPRLRALFSRDAVVDDISDEMQFHFDMRVDEYERRGHSKDEAMRMARARIGNATAHRDRGYDVRGGRFVETVVQDVRHSLRLLRKQPAFAIPAILTLALGIGASTALFSVIDATVLRPMPFEHPEQLFQAYVAAADSKGVHRYGASLDDVRAWRDDPAVISAGAFRSGSPILVSTETDTSRRLVGELSDGALAAFHVAPTIGRDLSLADVGPSSTPVVLLGDKYWRELFGARADVLGRTIRLPDAVGTVIGVLPSTFFPNVDVWRSTPVDPKFMLASRRGRGNDTIVRLRAGVALKDVQGELAARSRRTPTLADQPITNVELRPAVAEAASGYADTLRVLALAVGALVLIGCVNVAGLLVARGTGRSAEFAIRTALGAGRSRLVRQLITESMVVSVCGGVVGVAIAYVALDALVAILPLRMPSSSYLSISLPVMAASIIVSLVSAVIFGIVPAVSASRVAISRGIGHGTREYSGGRLGRVLVAVEVALALILLSGAGLLVKTLALTLSVDIGFDPRSVITMEATPVMQTPEALSAYYPALLDAIRAQPGVAAAGASTSLPMGRNFTVGFVSAGAHRDVRVRRRDILPGFIEALGLRVVQGQLPTTVPAAPSAVINEIAASQLFGDQPAVGQYLSTFSSSQLLVVAVVSNVRQDGPLYTPEAEVLQFSTSIAQPMAIAIRPQPGVKVTRSELAAIAGKLGPSVTVENVRFATDMLGDSVKIQRNRARLFGLLGLLGLVLTIVGIAGVTSYAVSRRSQEIGVRLAIGASPQQAVRLILSSLAWPIAIGVAFGLGGAYLSTRVIAKFLFHTTPTDPLTFAVVTVGLTIAALTAAWVPAIRASRIDPVTVLREGV